MKEKFAKFMAGRYGTDRLNMFLVIVLLVCAVLNLFVRNGYFSVVLTSWEFLLIILIYIRMFSRNISKRYAENQSTWQSKTKSGISSDRKNTSSSREKSSTSIPAPSANRRSAFPGEREKSASAVQNAATNL